MRRQLVDGTADAPPRGRGPRVGRPAQYGLTLVETLVALSIVGVIIVFSLQMMTTAHRGTQDNINKQFATQKAMSMLEELKSVVQTDNGEDSTLLDNYDNGVTNVTSLTTQRDITDPGAPASGNTLLPNGKWLFERRITVQRIKGSENLRIVNVKVYVNDAGGNRILAEVAGVLSTIANASPPSQVYDVYLVAVENVPGWWVYMQNLVPFVESAMQDLELRHPGLKFRRHWIRKLSYGRDPFYTPFVNKATDSTQDIDSVYYYPGLLPAGSAVTNYYPPDFFTGRVNIDGTTVNGYDAEKNPIPYSLADQYNHGMRYEDEKALFDARVAAGLERADSPTLRLLIEDMYMHPGNYRNAIVINLHGELFPFPPIRNYSDPAKDPETYPYVRAVTHPERLRYANTDAVRLRVYSYHTNTAAPNTVPDWLGRNTNTPTPITITLKDILWTPTAGTIQAFTGGVDFNNDGTVDSYPTTGPTNVTTTPRPATGATAGMWYSFTTSGTDTIIRLYNSPLKTPCVTTTTSCDGGGLATARRLYGLEYIPSPVENVPAGTTPFSVNLADAGTAEKNTARWLITIPTAVLPANNTLAIETRIGSDVSTGVSVPTPNAPSNLSRTYAWRGTDVWLFGDANNDPNMPITERYQLLGDPRHLPYADSKMPHGNSGMALANPLGLGYNRYFDDFHMLDTAPNPDVEVNAASFWPGWSYLATAENGGTYYGVKNHAADATYDNDGWSDEVEIDMSRVFQIFRSAIVRSRAIYTTMTGFSYFYVGIGNEIGYDTDNGFPNSIPVSSKPYTGTGGTRNEQSITRTQIPANSGFYGGVKLVRAAQPASGYWWGMSWLGELYPDSSFTGATGYEAVGNLPTGTTAGRFRRVLREQVTANLPAGTAFEPASRRTAERGSTSYFWSGTASSTFHHSYASAGTATATLDTDGSAIAATYKIPLADSIANNRPFNINVNDTGMNPDHFLQQAYGGSLTLSILARYYRNAANIPGSSLVTQRDSSGNTAFVVVNGLSPTGESGTAFIARWSFLSLIQSYMAGGLYQTSGQPDPSRVRELPRIVISTPNPNVELNNPATVSVAWDLQWRRWDGLKYTPSYPNGFTDDTSVRFAVLYSRDNGRTWLYMQDNTPVTELGRKPVAARLLAATSYNWSTPAASFPAGNYVIRVEAYREGLPLHYSFHQYTAFIKR
ncbi:MAG TPA: prepilin-type N-terminal cleavage/methylation domain-containing protein [Thermoanaerobaculia bacterium]